MGREPEPVNQYAISSILGSVVEETRAPRFGGFGVVGTVGEYFRTCRNPDTTVCIALEIDRKMVRSFERMRDGWAPDRLLWDPMFAKAYVDQCRREGLDLPDEVLKRRIIGIRKNSRRYAEKGIILKESSRREPHRGQIFLQDAHAIEFSLMRLRYRYGASIDDILLNTRLAEEFQELARYLGSRLPPEQLRLGALYLRKTRFFKKKELPEMYGLLDLDLFERHMLPFGTFDKLAISHVPDEAGVAEIVEDGRYLFVTQFTNLRDALSPFIEQRILTKMADPFWQPEANRVSVSAYAGDSFLNIPIRRWQLKLISERKPLFNWPVSKVA